MHVKTPQGEVSHVCELQVHHATLLDSDFAVESYGAYSYFRDFFSANRVAAERRLERIVSLMRDGFPGELKTLNDMVTTMIARSPRVPRSSRRRRSPPPTVSLRNCPL